MTMTIPRMTPSVQLILKCMFIAICAMKTFGIGYPPSGAQTVDFRTHFAPLQTVEDAVQDNNIVAINEHLRTTDGHVDQQLVEIHKIASDVAGMQGENRIAYGVLSLIGTTSIVVSLKKKST